MHILPSAPAAAQEKYRIQAGTIFTGIVEIDVDVLDGFIVGTPPEYEHWVGRKLHQLEWWLTAKYGTSQTRRLGV